MNKNQLSAAAISWLRLIIGAMIATYLTLGKAPLSVNVDDWKVIINSGIAALIITAANALNPADRRYGIGAPSSVVNSGGDVETNTAP